MALEVIGAGFGRTGTESMKHALELLGFGPCHHMIEVISHPEQEQHWRKAVASQRFDWDYAFQNYRASVDWPSAFYWRELSEFYPDAKILLTVRPAEQWYESFSKTILEVIKRSPDPETLGKLLIASQVFHGKHEDRDYAISVYEQNIRDVQATIPKERLLTYHLGSGWEPLCEFLEVDIPDQPYPNTNKSEDFIKKLKRLRSEAKTD
ncbi:MAG: sulfotransferase family protein [Gammaproteobacteria bacterium]|nr:MAG: sulfotransferase family protein [Gammaproteobacteria bacterium]